VLETELRLKGESGDPDAALTDLIAFLSAGQLQAVQRRAPR
jgi:hypothetical protein